MLKILLNKILAFFKAFAKPIPKIDIVIPIEPVIAPKMPITPQERLYDMAKASLGIDASPNDLASDEYGCVESVDNIHLKAFGYFINGTKNKPTLSTIEAYKILNNSPFFIKTYDPEFGDIRICVTGTGNGKLKNGHIAIEGKYGIMSNNSNNGLFKENYTKKSWCDYYETIGGFTTHFFRRI